MEVLALKLHLAEADLNTLAERFIPPESPLEDVKLSIRPEGVHLKGVYPLLVNVAFECAWKVGVANGKVVATMSKLKAFGMPAMIFKSAVLKTLTELASKEFWVEVKGDDVHLDLEYLLARHVCHAKVYLRSIICGDGVLEIEAGK